MTRLYRYLQALRLYMERSDNGGAALVVRSELTALVREVVLEMKTRGEL